MRKFDKLYNKIISEGLSSKTYFDGYDFTKEQIQKLYQWITDYLTKGQYEADNIYYLTQDMFLLITKGSTPKSFQIFVDMQDWIDGHEQWLRLYTFKEEFTDVDIAVNTIVSKLATKNFTPYKDATKQYLVQGLYYIQNRLKQKETYSFKLVIKALSLEDAKESFIDYCNNPFSEFSRFNLINKDQILNNIQLYNGPNEEYGVSLIQNNLLY